MCQEILQHLRSKRSVALDHYHRVNATNPSASDKAKRNYLKINDSYKRVLHGDLTPIQQQWANSEDRLKRVMKDMVDQGHTPELVAEHSQVIDDLNRIRDEHDRQLREQE